MTADHSLNEVEALAKRACRGAGYPWGLAEDAGKAVRWLAAHQLPGVTLLADLLMQREGRDLGQVSPGALSGIWSAPSAAMCPLICGATLSDCAHLIGTSGQVEMSQVSHPLLLLPFAGFAAGQTGGVVRLSWQDVRVATDGIGICIEGDEPSLALPQPADIHCLGLPEMPGPSRGPQQRALVSASAWDRLHRFAHRTYAPATEASRLRGAGAGASDND